MRATSGVARSPGGREETAACVSSRCSFVDVIQAFATNPRTHLVFYVSDVVVNVRLLQQRLERLPLGSARASHGRARPVLVPPRHRAPVEPGVDGQVIFVQSRGCHPGVRSKVDTARKRLEISGRPAAGKILSAQKMTCFRDIDRSCGHNMAAQRACGLPFTHRALPRFSQTKASTSRAMSSPSASSTPQTTVVSPTWLSENLREVKLLDCSWYLPTMESNGIEEHCMTRIPGAQYFDVDRISDPSSNLPHMLPSEDQFAAACDALGIENDDQVVVYDGAGLFSAARAWWMFKAFGHENVAVLDGGAPGWTREGMEMDTNPVELETVNAASEASRQINENDTDALQTKFHATLDSSLVRSKQNVIDRCSGNTKAERLVDARPLLRWQGTAPEPRKGVRSGRVPGSSCVPFFSLLDETKRVKNKAEILETFSSAGIDLTDLTTPLVASCGTGVTACVLSLAAACADPVSRPKGLPVYDGSWTEWGAEDSGCPVETD